MSFAQHKTLYIIGGILIFLWYQGAFAGIGLPSAWLLNGGSNTVAK